MFSYLLFNVMGQNSTSHALNGNLVVKREKKWLKNGRDIFVRINGNLQGINRRGVQWAKSCFMGIIGV